MPPGKTKDVLRLFCSFSKYLQSRRFCAEFGQKCVLKKKEKKKKKRSCFLSDSVNKMSSNREQK